jgi:hypothetical protein
MLLNNDIQKTIVQIILHFQKKINVIMYIWGKKNLIQIISFEQNFNNIWICKVYVFVMFKMKYLINKMQCYILSQQVRWLDGTSVCLHAECQKDQTSQVVCAWSIVVSWSNILLFKSLELGA